jgi:hypothetical protein
MFTMSGNSLAPMSTEMKIVTVKVKSPLQMMMME